MQLTKLHGLGNDYLYLDTSAEDLSAYDVPALARAVSDRHFGLGADGLILVEPADDADFRMRIFNADGSEAEMCGNGVRAFAKFVFDHGLTTKTDLSVLTGAGMIQIELHVEGGKMTSARVDMGKPRLARYEIPMLGEPAQETVIELPLEAAGQTWAITTVSMGNPHCVIFVPEVASFPVTEVGPHLENHELFPARTNVEFVRVISEDRLEMRVWERGSGETLACGTGASACVVASALTGRTGRHVTVELLGGELDIEWAEDDHVFVTGPATEVYTAQVRAEIIAGARK